VKILIPLLALVQLSSVDASIVGIMDSGTDISHKDLAPKAWVNVNEKAGSLADLDGDGLPGDVNGWDFTANSAKVFDNRYNGLITDDVKTFYDYYSKYEMGLLTQKSPEIAWLQTHTKDDVLMNKVNFVGGYIHGTHVAGISSKNNPAAKILSIKMIPTEYQPLSSGDKKRRGRGGKNVNAAPTKTIEEYKTEVINSAIDQVNQMVDLNGLVGFHKADVVNQSFGIGYGDAVNFIKSGFQESIKRDPSDAELALIVKAYFEQLLKDGPRMFNAAPNTIFTIAAGNDSSNNDLHPDYPADIQADNKIVVAATNGYKAIADFSNYGATKVDVAAPGVAILSTAPTNTYIALSGTSQATPYVTNIIATMKDLNPALTARDLKAIVLGTVDVKDWLRGKVKTSGIVNKARALKAAELAKTQVVDLAISSARTVIADVPVEKSFAMKPMGLKLNFKPVRPSLLIQK